MKNGFGIGLAALVSVGIMSVGSVFAAEPVDPQMQTFMTQGATVFLDNCAACHGENGEGGVGPKLDGNAFIKTRANIINQVLFGAVDHGMPPFAPQLTDDEIAAVATYVRNSWSNSDGIVLARSVELRRAKSDAAAK